MQRAVPCRRGERVARWRTVKQSRQSGDAHERAEQPLAVFGPVVGVRDATLRDGLRERPPRPQRTRRCRRRFEWRPPSSRQTGRAAWIEHGDVALLGPSGDRRVVQIALHRHSDDRSVPRGDRRRRECGLARPGRSDQRDGSTVALAARVPSVERVPLAVLRCQERSRPAIRPSSIRPVGGTTDVTTSGATSRGRASSCVGLLSEPHVESVRPGRPDATQGQARGNSTATSTSTISVQSQ